MYQNLKASNSSSQTDLKLNTYQNLNPGHKIEYEMSSI